MYLVTNMDLNVEDNWVKDLHEFISLWEHEINNIRNMRLNSDECSEIMEIFHRDMDLLLCRRPVGFLDDIVSKLEPLSNELDTSLAMALSGVSVKKEF
jgi:hypothetical protein